MWPRAKFNKNFQISFHFKKQIVPCKSTGRKVSFEWSHHRFSSTDSKVRTPLHNSFIHSGSERVNLYDRPFNSEDRRDFDIVGSIQRLSYVTRLQIAGFLQSRKSLQFLSRLVRSLELCQASIRHSCRQTEKGTAQSLQNNSKMSLSLNYAFFFTRIFVYTNLA